MEICTIMNRLGYSEVMRRRRAWNESLSDHKPTVITAGSKAEGLTCLLESNWDVLYVEKNVLCVESGINLYTIHDDIYLFRMDTRRAYPGHCRLLQKRPGINRHDAIINALCIDGHGDILLSSRLFIDHFSDYALSGAVFHEQAGPSRPYTLNGVFHFDRHPTNMGCQTTRIIRSLSNTVEDVL
ncbi:hypothetical protein DPMN_039491 [Dreissena polymorpha]|uniref:Uncharacterized protein n=1 Tax=Dreissena polymorpha TaxID=45954 RepID=A0A9D4CTE8_DREPO|nr:hypothetical protein DPMN_039491 [Dreissena polymorpha]